MPSTPTARFGIAKPLLEDGPASIETAVGPVATQVEALGALDIQVANLGARPAAGIRGRFCHVVDIDTLYRDTGSAWKTVSGPDLAALEALSTTGLAARTGPGAWVPRSIVGTTNRVSVSNGDGVAGNPTLSTPQDIHSGATPTFTQVALGAPTQSNHALRQSDVKLPKRGRTGASWTGAANQQSGLVTVIHGLGVDPASIQLTVAAGYGGSPVVYSPMIDDHDATQFTCWVRADAAITGVSIGIDWAVFP
jgi:hypothetical protein